VRREGHGGRGSAVAVHEGRSVSGPKDNTINVGDASSGALLRTLEGHGDSVSSVTVHEGLIVSGSYDKTIKVWDASSGALLRTLKGHGGAVYSVTVHEGRIVSGSWDKTIKVWRNDFNSLASYPKETALSFADAAPFDLSFTELANQILYVFGLPGLDAALDILLSLACNDHDKLFICHHVVNNPAAVPLVSLLVLFFGQALVDLVDPYTDRTVYECSAKPVKRAIDERLQFLGRFKVVDPSIHQSATSKANTVLDTSQDGAPAAVMKFLKDRTQYEREIAARGGGLDPAHVVGIVETSDGLDPARFKAEAEERDLYEHGILMEAGT